LRDDDNDPVLLVEGNVLTKTVALQPSARDFVVLANERVQINGRVEAHGNLHANGKIEVGPEAKLSLGENATATASAAVHAAPIALPNYAFIAEGENQTVGAGATLELTPESYGDVIVAENATLRLSSGEYYLRSLDLGANSKLVVDNGDGYVNIFVVNDLKFAARAQVTIAEAELTSDVAFWTLNDPQVEIGPGAMVQGRVIAQNGDIHFAANSKFKGAAIANNVIIDGNVLLAHHSSPINLPTTSATATAQETKPVTSYELAQNYPNPFSQIPRFAGNPSTVINFALPEAGKVTLRIYNETGQLVRTLVDREMSAGRHQLPWNARNQLGNPVAAGVYFYQMTVTGQNGQVVFSKTQRMTLVK
jgi:cytoskeletal protein CcmA (bactofilin family)